MDTSAQKNYGKFAQKVFAYVSKIPRGKVTTYGQVAKAIHCTRAARAVGNALNGNTDFEHVPCHRVVRSDGRVGGYVKGKTNKIDMLTKEGVEIQKGTVDLSKYLFVV